MYLVVFLSFFHLNKKKCFQSTNVLFAASFGAFCNGLFVGWSSQASIRLHETVSKLYYNKKNQKMISLKLLCVFIIFLHALYFTLLSGKIVLECNIFPNTITPCHQLRNKMLGKLRRKY